MYIVSIVPSVNQDLYIRVNIKKLYCQIDFRAFSDKCFQYSIIEMYRVLD